MDKEQMESKETMRQTHIGEYLARESPEERVIQSQLRGLVLWELVFSGLYCQRGAVKYTHGIQFEIRPKENGHNVPHCHACY